MQEAVISENLFFSIL